MAKNQEELIAKHMKTLQITREEAIQLIADDEAIDKGAKLFELDPELEKGAKKARQATRKAPTTPTKRERKADNDKAFLIDTIKGAIEGVEGVADLSVTNAEREMVFTCNGRKFKVVLSAPRS